MPVVGISTGMVSRAMLSGAADLSTAMLSVDFLSEKGRKNEKILSKSRLNTMPTPWVVRAVRT